MHRAKRVGLDVPVVYFIDSVRNRIVMERIHGITAKAYLAADTTTNEGM